MSGPAASLVGRRVRFDRPSDPVGGHEGVVVEVTASAGRWVALVEADDASRWWSVYVEHLRAAPEPERPPWDAGFEHGSRVVTSYGRRGVIVRDPSRAPGGARAWEVLLDDDGERRWFFAGLRLDHGADA